MLWPCALVSFPSTGFTAYPLPRVKISAVNGYHVAVFLLTP